MESTLSLQKSDFESKTAAYLGFGRGPLYGEPAWSTRQTNIINDCVQSGLRNFYFPMPDQSGVAYEWSFLKPSADIEVPSGVSAIQLPDDFGGVQAGDQVTVSVPAGQYWQAVDLIGLGQIKKLIAQDSTLTGWPRKASVVPLKATSVQGGQRFELLLWPIPDQDYTLNLPYAILPEILSGSYPFALGGATHAETILESCLAIAEQRYDDNSGLHTAKFAERLQASVSLDRMLKPQTAGYNGDRGRDNMYRRNRGQDWLRAADVTFGGVDHG